MCSERLCSSWSTSDTRRVTLVNNSVINRERRTENGIVTTTNGTYPLSSMTYILSNGYDGDREIVEVITST
jgi:hypothetical protein